MQHLLLRTLGVASVVLALSGRSAGQCMRWDGTLDLGPNANEMTCALASFDDGSGPSLYSTNDTAVGRWTGSSWVLVGNDYFDNFVFALHGYDDGTGAALYAGGSFHQLTGSGSSILALAKLVGGSWHPVGNGVPASSASVTTLMDFDDGGGRKLYVGGSFDSLPPFQSDSLLAWDGTAWHDLGTGLGSATIYPPLVYSMCEYNDGGGPALYVGGVFATAGGVPASGIAKWNGSTWSALGSGLGGPPQHPPAALALAVYDDGNGPALYVAGQFTSAGGVPANGIAKWNGNAWSALPGVGATPGNQIFALATHDDGNGQALYVANPWSIFPQSFGRNLVRWDGSTWSTVGAGAGGYYRALLSFDDGQGGGPGLILGGDFTTVGGNVLSRDVARWYGACTHTLDPICVGDGTFGYCPCSNYGTSLHGCGNSASAAGALLTGTGTPSPDTLVLKSTPEPATSTSMFLQSDVLLPAPHYLGDGILCVGGQVRRLYVKTAVNGLARAPTPNDPTITHRSAALGDPIAPGSVRYYQVWYRDSVASYCTQSAGSYFNLSNGLRVVW